MPTETTINHIAQTQPDQFVPQKPDDFIGPAARIANILTAKAAALVTAQKGTATILLHGPPGTRSPLFARKLSRRSDSCLVARGVAGGYLRTFAFQHGLSWGRRLIARYTSIGMAANERFLNPNPPVMCRSEQNGSVWRARNQNAAVGRWEQ